MITVDTITDDDICELRAEHGAEFAPLHSDAARFWPGYTNNGTKVVDVCMSALGEIDAPHALIDYHGTACKEWCIACRNRRDARRRCAEILNARAA